MKILNCTTEYMKNPLGIESTKPRFSWMMESDERDILQISYRIIVSCGSTVTWDSGKIADAGSVDIEYKGERLKPCTLYNWKVTVEDNMGNFAGGESFFETGFMDGSQKPWENAQWIGSSKPALCAETKGVFALEAKMKICGTRAGIIFGAEDERLKDKNKNIQCVEGKNRISYEIDVSSIPAKMIISRVGYCKNDREGVPFAVSEIIDVDDSSILPITQSNKNDWHTLRVEVYGNTAKAFVDGICVDGERKHLPFLPQGETVFMGRQLNPLAANDTITFPRLHKIGLTTPCNGKAIYEYYKVCDLRQPAEELFRVPADKSNIVIDDMGDELIFSPSTGGIPVIRRGFATKGTVKKARLYISARGIYDAAVNGMPITGQSDNKEVNELLPEGRGCGFLLPGASQFDKHLFYNVYDITNMLTVGENAIGVMLSSGWWSDSQTFSLENHNYFGDRPSFMAKLIMEYDSGETETIVTDTENWKLTDDGPILYSGYFGGERYDATKEENIKDFSKPGFNDSGWYSPAVITPVKIQSSGGRRLWPNPNHTEPQMLCHPGEGVKAFKIMTAVDVKEVRKGVYVYDMAQNMVGVPHIKIKGKKGTKIWIRYGEIMYPYLEEYGELQGALLTENLRDAESNDIYYCKGDENREIIFPHFTFHGYRYVEISGVDTPPEVNDVKGIVISSFTNRKGDFSCNNQGVNRLYKNVLWSQRANFISIPTDCPQRNERMGWMGDAQVFASTAAYNDDVRLFFERYLISVRDLQGKDGRFPCIAPIGGGFGGIAWESAGVIIPWTVYEQYGNTKILRDSFDSMVKYGEYLISKIKDGVINLGGGMENLGDWLAADLSTDGPLIWDSIAIHDMEIIAKSAKILGEVGIFEKYSSLMIEMKRSFNEIFIDAETGKTRGLNGEINDTQCSYALPLAYEIFNPENTVRAAAILNKKTIDLDYTLTTGFIGTPCIAPALSDNGYSQTAYKLLCQSKYPSWLYPVTQGATSIWERWNSFTVENGFGGNNSMNSFNHYSLGAVAYWMYSSILGISRGATPGFKSFELKPEFNKEFECAHGYYKSEYGRIGSSWSYDGNAINYSIEIPANTKAKIILPIGDICEGNNKIIAESCGNKQIISLGSGKYNFRITF